MIKLLRIFSLSGLLFLTIAAIAGSPVKTVQRTGAGHITTQLNNHRTRDAASISNVRSARQSITTLKDSNGDFISVSAVVINGASPINGPVGTLLTLQGSNLSQVTSVSVGSTKACPISNDGAKLVVMVMPGTTTGAITVNTAAGATKTQYTFTITSTPYPSFQQGAKIVGSGNIGTARQGTAVAVSADGNTAVVGGMMDNNNQGAAWFYTRQNGNWVQQSKVTPLAGNAAGFGTSVAISADGKTAIIGGPYDNQETGAAWIFKRNDTGWKEQAKLIGSGSVTFGMQGIAVAISGDGKTAIVGGPNENGYQGVLWIFTNINDIWSEQTKLPGQGNRSLFGSSVAISADGNTLVTGGGFDNNTLGAAWVYQKNGTTWALQSKLVGTGAIGQAYEGGSVAISADGNTVLIGGERDNNYRGAAWVFTRSGSLWNQKAKLTGVSQTVTLREGFCVSLSADGTVALVSAIGYNNNQGGVFVFGKDVNTWNQRSPVLTGTGGIAVKPILVMQGQAVAISATGSTALSTSYQDNNNQGAVWAFAGKTAAGPLLTNLVAGAGTLTPAFSNQTVAYTLALPAKTTSIKITPVVADSTSIIKINGTQVTTPSAIPVIKLHNGSNDIVITVTGADQVSTTTYHVAAIVGSSTTAAIQIAKTLQFKYGDDDQAFSVISTNTLTPVQFKSSDSTKAYISKGLVHITGAGAVTITASQPAGNGFLAAPDAVCVLNILKSAITIAADTKVIIYGTPFPQFTYSSTGYIYGEGPQMLTQQPQMQTTASNLSRAGTYPVTPSGASSPNYTFIYQKGSLIINKAQLTITPADTSRTYGTVNPTFRFKYKGFVNNENENSLLRKPFANTSSTILSAVGNYQSAAYGASSYNYDIQYGTGKFTISKAPLIIAAVNKVKIYGAAPVSYSITYTGFKNHESINVLPALPTINCVANSAASPVGTYPITINGPIADNYQAIYQNGILTINPAILKVIPLGKSRAYGSENPVLSPNITGFVNGENAQVLSSQPLLSSTATIISPVGSYPISASGALAQNYIFTYYTGKLTVTKALLKVTADNQSRPANSPNPAFTITYSGFVNAETANVLLTRPSAATTATALSKAGRYVITVGGGLADNYNFSYVPGALTITAPTKLAFDSDFELSTSTEKLPVTAEPVVHTALSPNGDGINDFLLIEGIENFPDNKLTIVNRAGSSVYKASGYNNTTTRYEGKNAQPGTYFYLLNYVDKGEQKSKSGYFIIKN